MQNQPPSQQQPQVDPFPFSRRFTGHRELINHLYSHQDVDIHILKDAIANDNIDFLIEVIVFLLDRFSQINLNVEEHFRENLIHGHRIGEAAVFNFLGLNKGCRSITSECQYLFQLLSGTYSARLLDLFRIVRSRHFSNGTEFREAIEFSPLREYEIEVIENTAIPPLRRENYYLAYTIQLLVTGRNHNNANNTNNLQNNENNNNNNYFNQNTTNNHHNSTNGSNSTHPNHNNNPLMSSNTSQQGHLYGELIEKDSIIKLLGLDIDLSKLNEVFCDDYDYTPLSHYKSITSLLEFFTGLIFCTGRYELFDALFGSSSESFMPYYTQLGHKLTDMMVFSNDYILPMSPLISSQSSQNGSQKNIGKNNDQNQTFLPQICHPENCPELPYIVRRSLLQAGLSTAYGTYQGNLELKMNAELELHHPTNHNFMTEERRGYLEQYIISLGHEADLRFHLFISLLNHFGSDFWSVEDIRSTHLIATAYNDTETLQLLQRVFKINISNMSNYSNAIRKTLISNTSLLLIDLPSQLILDPESPEHFLSKILPNFVRRNLTKVIKFLLRSHVTQYIPSLVLPGTNILGSFANGQLATNEMLELLLKSGVQPCVNSKDLCGNILTHPQNQQHNQQKNYDGSNNHNNDDGSRNHDDFFKNNQFLYDTYGPTPSSDANFLIQIFSSTLPTEKCLELVTTVLKTVFENQQQDQNPHDSQASSSLSSSSYNQQSPSSPNFSNNLDLGSELGGYSTHIMQPQVTIGELFDILKTMFGSLSLWRQEDGSAHVLLIQFLLDNQLIEPLEWQDLYSNPMEYVMAVVGILKGGIESLNPNSTELKIDLTAFSPSQLNQYYNDISTIIKLLIPNTYTQQLYRLSVIERQELSFIILQFLITIGHVELISYILELFDIPITTQHFINLITQSILSLDYRNLLIFHNYLFTNLSNPHHLTTLFKQDYHLSTVGFPDYIDFLTLLDEFDHCPADYLAMCPEFINPRYMSCPNQQLKEAVFGPQFRAPNGATGGDANNNNNGNNRKSGGNGDQNGKNQNNSAIHPITPDLHLNRFIEFDMSDFSNQQLQQQQNQQLLLQKESGTNPQTNQNNDGRKANLPDLQTSSSSNDPDQQQHSLFLHVLRGGYSIGNSGTLTFEDNSTLLYNTDQNRRSTGNSSTNNNTSNPNGSNFDDKNTLNNPNNVNNRSSSSSRSMTTTSSSHQPGQPGSGNPPLHTILNLNYINNNIFQTSLEWLYSCFDQNNQLAVGDRSPFLSIFEIYSNSFFISEQQRKQHQINIKTERTGSIIDPFTSYDTPTGPNQTKDRNSTTDVSKTNQNCDNNNNNNTANSIPEHDEEDPNTVSPPSLLSFFQLFCTPEIESLLISQPHGLFLPILSKFFPQHTFYNTAFLSSYALTMVPSSLLSTIWCEDYIFQGLVTLAMVTDKVKVSTQLYTGFQTFLSSNPHIQEYIISRRDCLDAQEQLSRHIMLDDYEYRLAICRGQHQLLLEQQRQRLEQQQEEAHGDNIEMVSINGNLTTVTTTNSTHSHQQQQQQQHHHHHHHQQQQQQQQHDELLSIPFEFNPIDFDLIEPMFKRESLLTIEQLNLIIDHYNLEILPNFLHSSSHFSNSPSNFSNIWNLQQFIKIYYPFKFPKRGSNVIILQCLSAVLASAQNYLPLVSRCEREWREECENVVLGLYHYLWDFFGNCYGGDHHQQQQQRQQRQQQQSTSEPLPPPSVPLHTLTNTELYQQYEHLLTQFLSASSSNGFSPNPECPPINQSLLIYPQPPHILYFDNHLPNLKPFIYILRHIISYQPIPNLLLKAFYITLKPQLVHSLVDMLDLYLISGGKLIGQPNNRHLAHFDQVWLSETVNHQQPYQPYPAQYYIMSQSVVEKPVVYAYYYLLLLKMGGHTMTTMTIQNQNQTLPTPTTTTGSHGTHNSSIDPVAGATTILNTTYNHINMDDHTSAFSPTNLNDPLSPTTTATTTTTPIDYADISRIVTAREQRMTEFILEVWQDKQLEKEKKIRQQTQYKNQWLPILTAVGVVASAVVVIGGVVGMLSFLGGRSSSSKKDEMVGHDE